MLLWESFKSTSASSRFVDSIVFSASCKNKQQSLLRRLLWYNLLPEVTNLRRVETTSNAANIKYVSKDPCSVLLVTMRWNQKTERCHTDKKPSSKKTCKHHLHNRLSFTRNFDFKYQKSPPKNSRNSPVCPVPWSPKRLSIPKRARWQREIDAAGNSMQRWFDTWRKHVLGGGIHHAACIYVNMIKLLGSSKNIWDL